MDFDRETHLSASFFELPWSTPVLRNSDLTQALSGCSEATEYVEEIVTRESQHAFHQGIEYARRFLTGEMGENSNRRHLADALGCLLEYRLVDILLWRHIRIQPPPCAEYFILNSKMKAWPGDQLGIWPGVIRDAYAASKRLKRLDFDWKAKSVQDSGALLDLMGAVEEGGVFMKILGNFVQATYHLQYLLQGNLDLYGTDEDAITGDAMALQRATPFAKKNLGPGQSRAALHIALVFGPVYLLKRVKIKSALISRLDLINTWRVLGSQQPKQLMECNLRLWDLLVNGATGNCSLYTGLCQTLEECVNLLDTDTVEFGDHNWYSSCHARFASTPVSRLTKHVEANETAESQRRSVNAPKKSEGLIEAEPNDPKMDLDLDEYGLGPSSLQTHSGTATPMDSIDVDMETYETTGKGKGCRPEDIDMESEEESGAIKTRSERSDEDDDMDADNEASDGGAVSEQERPDKGECKGDSADAEGSEESETESASDGSKGDTGKDEEEGRSKEDGCGKNQEDQEGNSEDDADGSDDTQAFGAISGVGKTQETKPTDSDPPTRRSLRLTLKGSGDTTGTSNADSSGTNKDSALGNASKIPSSTGGRKRGRGNRKITSASVVDDSNDQAQGAAKGSKEQEDSEIVYLGSNVVKCKVDLGVFYKSMPRVKTEENDTTLSFERSRKGKDPDEVARVYSNIDIDLFDLGTKKHTTYRPSCHYEETLQLLYDVNAEAKKNYYEGLPAYFTPGAPSSVHLMSYDEFQKASTETLSAIFKEKHIAVYGKPGKEHTFSRSDIEHVFGCSVYATRTIQDQTIECKRSYESWNRQGCIMDILNSAALGDQGKSLNGLDNKLPFDWDFHSVLETDRTAWREAMDLAFCPKNNQFPMTDLRWGLVANAGCYSLIHIDSNGFCTVIEVLTGLKEWFLGKPKSGKDVDMLGSIYMFTGDYSTETANLDRFTWEKICLSPSTILIQRPGTPHIVFTKDHSMVRGRFFYSTATIRPTIFGIYHDLSNGKFVTNSEHIKASIALLTRILAFYHLHFVGKKDVIESAHLPQLSDFDSIFDVLALCAHFEVANALYMDTQDSEDEQVKMRHFFICNRKRARELINWIVHHYVFFRDGAEVGFREYIYWPYVAKVAYLICKYRGETKKSNAAKKKASEELLKAFRQCFKHPATEGASSHLEHLVQSGLRAESETFCWAEGTINVEASTDCGEFVYVPVNGLNGDDIESGINPKDVSLEDFPDLITNQRDKKRKSESSSNTKKKAKKV